MSIKVRRLSFPTGSLPGPVEITLGDNATEEEATIWISVQVESQRHTTDKLSLILREALETAQNAIDEGKQNSSTPRA
ncbi:hypothetical protein [Hwanghaeella sp. LZ110]|uniref:hypothetical protein n=1 Tax=Hwanghaeella sp. LZ110 TaxID=3402810 RepID=UPI003B680740